MIILSWKVEKLSSTQNNTHALQTFHIPNNKKNLINKAIWKNCPVYYVTIRKKIKFCLNCGFKVK